MPSLSFTGTLRQTDPEYVGSGRVVFLTNAVTALPDDHSH